MKKYFLLCILFAAFGWIATAKDLQEGETLVKTLKLGFNDEAKASNAFISWDLVGDWDKFNVSFSQGTLNKNTFTVKAKEYKDFADGKNGIALTVQAKPKTPKGEYSLSMKVKEVSDELNFPKNSLNLNINVNYLPPEPDLLKILLKYGSILLALGLITWLVLHFTAKFPGGYLQVGRDEVSLKGKKEVSLKKELGVEFADDADVVFVKKRLGSFQGPRIKEMKNCSLERDGVYLSKGTVILLDEEIRGLKDSSGNEVIIRYY